MQDLTLVGVHDDGEHLVLAGPDGQRYRGPGRRAAAGRRPARPRPARAAADRADRRAAPARHPGPDPGRAAPPRRSPTRPACRSSTSGATRARCSPSASSWPGRRGPSGSAAARGGTPGSYPTLDELVAARLAAREVDPDAAAWDAWRDDDGTWIVRLTFSAGGRERRADWTYDVAAAARHAPRRRGPLAHRRAAAREPRCRGAAPSPPCGTARCGRADAPRARARLRRRGRRRRPPGRRRPRRRPAPAAAPRSTCSTPCASAAGAGQLRARRRRRADEPADALEIAVDQLRVRAEALGEPPAAHPPRSRPAQLEDAELLALPEAPAPPHGSHPAPPSGSHPRRTRRLPPSAVGPAVVAPASGSARTSVPQTAPVARPAVADTSAPARPASLQHAEAGPAGPRRRRRPGPDRRPVRRSRRASVPSWDDIVFGSRRD